MPLLHPLVCVVIMNARLCRDCGINASKAEKTHVNTRYTVAGGQRGLGSLLSLVQLLIQNVTACVALGQTAFLGQKFGSKLLPQIKVNDTRR